ncbi:MAG: hypothetical protein VYC65_06550 [Chloroflexota bacterium]|nr:hypothetical protein [Chloroflexota bacterium]
MRYWHRLESAKHNPSTVICGGMFGLLIALTLNVAEHGHWESPVYPSTGIYLTVTLLGFLIGSVIVLFLVPGSSDSRFWPRGPLSWILRGLLFGLGFPFLYGGTLPLVSWFTAVRVSVFSVEEIINIGFNSLFQIPGSMIVNLFLGVPTALLSIPVFAILGWAMDRVNSSTNMRLVWVSNVSVVVIFALTIAAVLTTVEAEKLATFGWN